MRRRAFWLLALLPAFLFAGYILLRGGAPRTTTPAAQNVAAFPGEGPTTGYERAIRVRTFRFPADFGPHPAFLTEWWYFTGNLDGANGRRFGYELSLFRIALTPKPPERPSRWATNQMYMAHFALTDAKAKRFHYFQKLERGAVGLAGAQAAPFHVWVDNWGVEAAHDDNRPWRLHAAAGGIGVDLDLDPLTGPVLQGDHGLSRKSSAPGNASYYYSLPRLATRGTLSVNGRTFAVNGLSWMDREWSTSALAANQAGWDWFGLQLSDGSDLMFYRLRRSDGRVDRFSQGSFIDAQGHMRPLSAEDVRVEVQSYWRSPRGGVYPARWRLLVKPLRLALEVTPILADQELDVAVRYWEGAVDVRGMRAGTPLAGRGYVELTGYAHTATPQRKHRN